MLQRRCASSFSGRSSLAWPQSLNEDFIMASAWARAASSGDCMPAQPTTASASKPRPMSVVFMVVSSALDGGSVEHAAIGVAGQEHRERDRSVRGEFEFREALLAEAV